MIKPELAAIPAPLLSHVLNLTASSFLAAIPWWGWALIIACFISLAWLLSPYKRVERAFGATRYRYAGVPTAKEMVKRFGSAPLIQIARASGSHAQDVFRYGLPVVKGRITSVQTLRDYGQALLQIAQASGSDAPDVFEYGLPAVKDLIQHYGIEPFVEFAQISRQNTRLVFLGLPPLIDVRATSLITLRTCGQGLAQIAQGEWQEVQRVFADLPALKDQIQEYGIQPFVRIAQASGLNADYQLFKHGLPAVKDLISQFGIEPFVEIVQTVGDHATIVLWFGLPAVRAQITNVELLVTFSRALAQIADDNEKNARVMFQYGLPVVQNQITSVEMLKTYSDPLAQIARGSHALEVIQYGLPMVQGQITSVETLKAYAGALDDVARSCGSHAQHVFRYGFAVVRDQITSPQDLKTYGLALCQIAQASGRHVELVLKDCLPNVKDLIQQYGIEPFVLFAEASGEGSTVVFRDGLPAVKDLIEEYGIWPFLEIAQANRNNAYGVFNEGLPAIKDLVRARGIEPFVQIAKATGHAAACVFEYALPAVRELVLKHGFSKRKLLIEALQKRHLRKPREEHWEDMYGETYTTLHDPDAGKRVGIQALISLLEQTDLSHFDVRQKQAEVRTEAREEVFATAGSSQEVSNIPKHPEIIPVNLAPLAQELLDFLKQRDLSDAVLIGGAVRDARLGRNPKDFDVTFQVRLSPEEIAWDRDPKRWNRELGSRLAPRMECLASAFEITVTELLERKARFRGVPVHYVGPYFIEQQTGESRSELRARYGAVIGDDGRMYSLDPMLSINSLGVLTDGHWVGDPSALVDLETKQIRTLKSVKDTSPDWVLRALLLEAQLGFQLSHNLRSEILSCATEWAHDPEAFVIRAEHNKDFQEGLTAVAQIVPLEELDQLRLTPLLLRTSGTGAEALRKAIETSSRSQGTAGGP